MGSRAITFLGGPGNVAAAVLSLLGLVLVAACFTRILSGARDAVLPIAASVMVVGLVPVLTWALTSLVTRGERAAFQRFFGSGETVGVVPSLKASEFELDLEPPEGADGAKPRGTKLVPFHDLSAAICIAELFEQYGTDFIIERDGRYGSGMLPQKAFVAIGLGFNSITRTVSRMSRLFDISFRDLHTDEPKDDFTVGGIPHGRPDAKTDFALIARIAKDVEAPGLVCAGRTAAGTAAAGYFLKHHWAELYELYGREEQDFDEPLAVELEHDPTALMTARITRYAFPRVGIRQYVSTGRPAAGSPGIMQLGHSVR